MAGRVAVVTGAGQGVGRGIALALAREGASLLLAGRTLSKCEAVAHEVTELGGTATAIRCDVALRDDVDAAISAAVSEFGGLDALVNNAQSAVQKLLVDTTDADLELSYRTGTLATFYGMQAAYPHLVARGGGSIVNFGSSTAIEGNATFGSYAMAKEAIRGLSRVAAREWGRDGIRVNVVVPSALSPSAEAFRDARPEAYQKQVDRIPLRRMGDPESDIGRAVVSLVSDDLSYMTGQTVMLTGGA
ncbi:MAG: SDR family oxidoreductase [Mycolicibacterium sp.]|nr:SDR family oxidoreductase [Mycolicibacterium sp.]